MNIRIAGAIMAMVAMIVLWNIVYSVAKSAGIPDPSMAGWMAVFVAVILGVNNAIRS